MSNQNIVITGAGGQLGLALQAKYPTARALKSEDLDISDSGSVQSFDWTGVDIIINAAAYTNVDGAEQEKVQCWKVNVLGPSNLCGVAIENNITLIHISSDYVFDGKQSNHTEDEGLNPLSVYGRSKAAGDLAVQLSQKHYILRTSWVIGDGNNFVRTMAGLAEKNISPTVVHDQVGRLTFTSELVGAIDHLSSNNAPYGTYNVSNDGDPSSWADITRQIFKDLGRDDLEVTNTTTAEYFAGKEGIAPRPLQSTLDLSKIKATGFETKDWKVDLASYLKGEKS